MKMKTLAACSAKLRSSNAGSRESSEQCTAKKVKSGTFRRVLRPAHNPLAAKVHKGLTKLAAKSDVLVLCETHGTRETSAVPTGKPNVVSKDPTFWAAVDATAFINRFKAAALPKLSFNWYHGSDQPSII
jgi:hypothetical protein